MRAALVAGIVLVAGALVATRAQIVTEQMIATDSIVILNDVPADSAKSPGLAMLGNLVFPGLGHQYLGKRGRALTYFSAELALIFGAVLCESRSRRLFDDARTIAWTYAGARGGAGANDEYWDAVSGYLDSDGYNHVQELNRTPEEKYVEPNLQWAWADTSYQDDFVETRDDATSFHIAATFMIGGMILNRVVSFVDARISTKRRAQRGPSRVGLSTAIDPFAQRVDAVVSVRY